MRFAPIAAALIAAASAAAAQDESVANFYDGTTVTVLSPSGVGGSIYQYALLVSNHLGKHIPGEPTVIVEARPGGGGVKAASWVVNAAPQDGTIVAELHPSSMIVPITRGTEQANYDASQFHFLGSVAVRSYVGAVWHEAGVSSLEEMTEDKPVVFGASGTGSPSYQTVKFVAHVSGANLDVIPGYNSGGDTNLAMERGEVGGRGNFFEGFLATNPDWVDEGKVKFVFRMGPENPALEGVPTPADYVDTDEERAMLRLLEAPMQVGQSFYVAPGVPEDRVEALRKAFAAMLEDPKFLAEAEQMNLVVNPRSWEEVRAVIDEVYNDTPPETAAALEEILARE